MWKAILFLMLVLFSSCKPYKYNRTGQAVSDIYMKYCNDSLHIYSTLFGDFKQENFSSNISKNTRKFCRQLGIKKNSDQILYSSETVLPPKYFVLGVISEKINLIEYEKRIYDSSSCYVRKGKLNSFNFYDAAFPLKNSIYRMIFFEPRDSVQNIIDYERMTDLSISSMRLSNCEKKSIAKVSDSIFWSSDGGNYLAYKTIQHIKYNYSTKDEESIYKQYLATYLSFIDNETAAVSIFPFPIKAPKEKNPISMDQLISLISDNQILLFNESHHRPSNRYLVTCLLKKLYGKGFRYLGLEGLQNMDGADNFSFPSMESGFYVREPSMANLIRSAKHIGFDVFGYDSQGEDRETLQARNIINHTLAKDAGSKVIILAGYSHIDRSNGWMAEKLMEMSGIKPYTINQTKYANPDDLHKGQLFNVMKAPDDENDLYISNNLTYHYCLPGENCKQEIITIPVKIYNNNIIQIYIKDEYSQTKKAIPIYIKELNKDEQSVTIEVPAGTYTGIVKKLNGEVKFQTDIEVK